MIALNDFKRAWEVLRGPALDTFNTVGQSGHYILGEEVWAFEAALAAFWGFRYAVGVASGLDALEISLRILGCGPGERVLTTPLSAFATTLAIVKLGAVPVFVDTDEHGLMDLQQSESVLRSRPDVRFMVPVHLYGHALDLERLSSLRTHYGCHIVEDCAQSVGARFSGRATGTAGEMAATSFYPTKNLGALGDGGAILTDNQAFYQAALALRNYGETSKYESDVLGYNSRLDELQAALLNRVLLPELPVWTARRRAIAAAYLAGIRHPEVHPLAPLPASESAWHLFPVCVPPEKKAAFRRHMTGQDVMTSEHYPLPSPRQRALVGVPVEVVGDISRAARICASEVSLPVHPFLTDAEVAQVVEACNTWSP